MLINILRDRVDLSYSGKVVLTFSDPPIQPERLYHSSIFGWHETKDSKLFQHEYRCRLAEYNRIVEHLRGKNE